MMASVAEGAAMPRSPGRADTVDPARLGEEYGLGAYERTQVDKDWPFSRGCGVVLFPVAVIMIPTAVIPFFDPGQPAAFAFGLIWAPVTGALVVTGALLLWRVKPRSVHQTFWYSGGLLQLSAGVPEPRVLRWDEMTTLRVSVARPDESAAYVALSTACDERGTCVTTRGRALADRAARVLVPVVVPALIGAFDAGEPVSFGRLRIDEAGLTDLSGTEPALMAWPDIARIVFTARVRVGLVPAEKGRSVVIDIEAAPNAFLAHYVIEHAAARAGVPVSYAEDKRLPPRQPVPPGR
jgi:hypothetical protein